MIWCIAWLFVLLVALAVQSHRQYMRQYREIIRLENSIISLQSQRENLLNKLGKQSPSRHEDYQYPGSMIELTREQAEQMEADLRDSIGQDIFGHDWTYDDLPVQKCVH